jgi:aspartyl-tRNA synthetase
MASQGDAELPERPKGGEPAAPSKNALKKAAKDKEKAEKAAKRAEQERAQKEAAEANDTSRHHYGKLADGIAEPAVPTAALPTSLRALDASWEGKEVTIRARVHNARVQSAKLAFLDLRQRTENIQAVVAEGGERAISRAMVKWCGGLNRESIVLVGGVVRVPKEPIHSATLANLELHVGSVFVVAEGPVQLPMQVKDAMRPPPTGESADAEGQVDSSGTPLVNLDTRLNNRVLSLRTPSDQAIFQINAAVCALFREHLIKHQFVELQTPKIAGAATEGGAGVFEIDYFKSPAFLTQSPQFYKQMAIAGDMERVFEIGPVFRAENSNTTRHLTEV